jgi:GNAT superfamily N-acetyltransferase
MPELTRANEEVRMAIATDAFSIAAIAHRCWSARQLTGVSLPAIGVMEEAWSSAISSPPTKRHRVLVALSNGAVVGFAAIVPLSESVDEISEFLIDPDLTRRGHGSRLINAAADTSPSEVVGLSIWSDLEALNTFLASAGWGQSDRIRTLESADLTLTQHRWVTSLQDSV